MRLGGEIPKARLLNVTHPRINSRISLCRFFMSFDPDDDIDIFAPAPVKEKEDDNWRENRKWLDIVGISYNDCVNATGLMERLPRDHFVKKKNTPTQKPGQLVGFGKYKDLTIDELRKQQPQYYSWALENVNGFRARAQKKNN